MKRLLFILILLSFNFLLKGQSTFPVPSTGGGLPIKQFLGADSTLVGNKGIFWSKYGDVYGTFTDTTAANLTRIKQYPFARIATTTDQITWVRNKTANKWLTSGQAGGSLTNITTTIHGDTLIQCTTIDVPVCDTLIFTGLGGDTIYNFYFLNDSTAVACDSPQIVFAVDTAYAIQNCDTLNFPPLTKIIFQQGLEEFTPKIAELGSLWDSYDNPNTGFVSTWMSHSRVLNTGYNMLVETGWPIMQPVAAYFSQQRWGMNTDITTYLNNGSGIPTDLDYNNRVRFHIGYTGNNYGADNTTSIYPRGFFQDYVGYWNAVNMVGAPGYGMIPDDNKAKFGGLLIHTFDTLNNKSVTIFGNRPVLAQVYGSLNTDSVNLIQTQIASFKYNKQVQLYGYGSTSSFISSDTTNNKPQAFDVNGNEVRMAYWPGGGGVVAADNGTSLNGGNTVYLGGSALLSNTSILTSAFSLTIPSSNGVNTLRATNSSSGTGVYASSSSGTAFLGESGSTTALFRTTTATTNATQEVVDIIHNSSGTPTTGFGLQLNFALSSATVAERTANQLISKWVDATDATRIAQLDITATNVGSPNTIASFYGSGVVGIGISSGYTGTRLQVVDNSLLGASMVKLTSTSTAADNDNQRMMEITMTGTNAVAHNTVGYYVSNTKVPGFGKTNYGVYSTVTSGGGSGSGIGIYGEGGSTGVQGVVTVGGGYGVLGQGNTGSGSFGVGGYANGTNGQGIYGEGTLYGVHGFGVSNTAIFAQSTNGVGLNAESGTSVPIQAHAPSSTTNSVLPMIEIYRQTSGTGANGEGGSIDFYNESASGADQLTNKIISYYRDATNASRTAMVSFLGTVNATTDTLMKMGDYVNLTESSATLFAQTTVAIGKIAGGQIVVTIEANDATDFTSRTMRFTWVAVNKGGTTTITIGTPEEIVASSSGATLTATITAVDGGSGLVQFKANAVSSLTQTTLRCSYQMSKNF